MSSSRLNEINSDGTTLDINNLSNTDITIAKAGGKIGIGGNVGAALLEISGSVNINATSDAVSSTNGGTFTTAGG